MILLQKRIYLDKNAFTMEGYHVLLHYENIILINSKWFWTILMANVNTNTRQCWRNWENRVLRKYYKMNYESYKYEL